MTDYTVQRVNQTRGPQLRFKGKLIAEDEWVSRSRVPLARRIQLWETPEGNWVAVDESAPADGDGKQDVAGIVIEKGEAQAMQFAAMDFWQWETAARKMARAEPLRWRLFVEVE